MSDTSSSNGVQDSTAHFLYDLNVVLDYDYAERDRDLFPELSPHFAQHPELPLADRIVTAYGSLKSTDGSENRSLQFRGIVTAALMRSASVALGAYRTLVVLDVAKKVCPEFLSDDIWRRLLFRQEDQELPSWLSALAFRWSQWRCHIALSKNDWSRALKLVEAAGFETLAKWGLEQECPDEPNQGRFVTWLLRLARSRIEEDAARFREEEVDPSQSLERLEDGATPRIEHVFDQDEHTFAQWREQTQRQELEALLIEGGALSTVTSNRPTSDWLPTVL